MPHTADHVLPDRHDHATDATDSHRHEIARPDELDVAFRRALLPLLAKSSRRVLDHQQRIVGSDVQPSRRGSIGLRCGSLAVEFDVLPDFVTSVVFASTLLSPVTVTLMIAYLQSVS